MLVPFVDVKLKKYDENGFAYKTPNDRFRIKKIDNTDWELWELDGNNYTQIVREDKYGSFYRKTDCVEYIKKVLEEEVLEEMLWQA
jgi:hypothetical protein